MCHQTKQQGEYETMGNGMTIRPIFLQNQHNSVRPAPSTEMKEKTEVKKKKKGGKENGREMEKK